MDRIRSEGELVATGEGRPASVEFTRELSLRTVVLTLLLLWPVILFGRPGYIADSAAYEKGGQAAVQFVSDKVVGPPVASRATTSALNKPETEAAGVKGARSIAYSVAAYLLRFPGYTMVALAVVQSLIAAFLCVIMAASAGATSRRRFAVIALAMAAASPLPTFTGFALPDIFAGVLVVSLLLLFGYYERLSLALKIALVIVAAFAVTSHASVLPLALWLCVFGTALLLWRRKHETDAIARAAWLWAPVVIGALTTMAAGFVAFHETSVAAKRYPHALARSVSDGPARWYLEKECVKPRYAVCEVFGTLIPATVSGFMFKPGGLDERATPEQMDRIRAEEREIVIRAAMAYPGTELSNLGGHFFRQFFELGARPDRFGDRIETDTLGEPLYIDMPDRPSTAIKALNISTYTALVICLLWLGLRFRILRRRQWTLLAMLVSVLAVNAAFCVLASGVSDRYQARIAWAIPLFILSFALGRGAADRHARP